MARIMTATTFRIRSSIGFTLIELMIVVAIIGILAAVAIPNFIRYQLRSKTTEAKVILGGIKTSEEVFRAEIDNYSRSYGSPQELSEKGLLDAVTAGALGVDPLTPPELFTPAGGRAFGYSFTIELSPDRQHFVARAIPAAPGRSGDRSFFIDETGVQTFTCPPGTTYDPITDLCVPSDNYLLIQAIAAIQKIDALSGGQALPLARRLVQSSGVVAKVLAALDANGDQALTVDEALGENLLAAGRGLQPDFERPLRPGPAFPALGAMLDDYARSARDDLAPGIAGAPPVNVPLSDMNGDVAAFLALVR